jgi:thiamine-phosphate pyrophosphorylase
MTLARTCVVAITDRRLMVPAPLLASGDWPAIAAAFGHAIATATAGCPRGSILVQIREKDLDGGPLLRLVRAAQPYAPIFVNDRLDVALAADADGVHLPERGLPLATARALAPRLLIGVSRHAASLEPGAEPRAEPGSEPGSEPHDEPRAEPGDEPRADLIHLGPIWATPSKPTATPLGTTALARTPRAAPRGRALLVAVGGIDSPARAHLAAASGAAAVAVIRAAWSGASLAPFVAAVDTALSGL